MSFVIYLFIYYNYILYINGIIFLKKKTSLPYGIKFPQWHTRTAGIQFLEVTNNKIFKIGWRLVQILIRTTLFHRVYQFWMEDLTFAPFAKKRIISIIYQFRYLELGPVFLIRIFIKTFKISFSIGCSKQKNIFLVCHLP